MAFAPNVDANPKNQQLLSDGWFKYFGFRIQPNDIYCHGCVSDSPITLDRECPVRPCVIDRGHTTCAECEKYICEKLQERIIEYEEIQRKTGSEIPEEDRERFIYPYENRIRLEKLRSRN